MARSGITSNRLSIKMLSDININKKPRVDSNVKKYKITYESCQLDSKMYPLHRYLVKTKIVIAPNEKVAEYDFSDKNKFRKIIKIEEVKGEEDV